PPQELLDRLEALPHIEPLSKKKFSDILDEPIDSDQKLPPPLIIPWANDGAADVYFAFSRRMDAVQEGDDENRRDLSQRICENSIRIATIIAVGRNAQAVCRRDIEFAIDLCSRSFNAVVGGVERYMFERFEFPRLCEGVFNKMVADGGKMSEMDPEFGTS